MLIYACWSPICVADPSVLYSGVVPSQAHMGTDKNTDTYRDIYQERILRKNKVFVWNKLKQLKYKARRQKWAMKEEKSLAMSIKRSWTSSYASLRWMYTLQG